MEDNQRKPIHRSNMENQEKIPGSTVQFKNTEVENLEPSEIEKMDRIENKDSRCWCGRFYRMAKPLRTVELLILVALLALMIYAMIKNWGKLSTDSKVTAILLIALFATYLFVLSLDMISQIAGGTVPDTTMLLFVALGILLFAAAGEGVYFVFYPLKPNAVFVAVMILCIIEAAIFLLDIILLILNWRQSCMRVDRCPFGASCSNVTIYRPSENYSQKSISTLDPLMPNVRDVTTSVSDYERPSHPDLVNLHKFRKIGVGQRREYTDRPVTAPSLTSVKVIEVQTEPPQQKAVSDVESMIVADVKEEPAQTTSRCPVCANNWERYGNRRIPDDFGLCPTFLHLARGFGMCNCQTSLGMISGGLNAESTSATDLGVERKNQKQQRAEKK